MKKAIGKAAYIFQSNRLTLLLIITVAAVLRFWHYGLIPFTHDEFSALFRLSFDSFGELIEKGVKIDGHPAGVQVFLYYYTKLAGTAPWLVKLPFTLAGLYSIFLLYRIASRWFSETAALLSAAYMATIQIMVMYSQIARPYISGVFLILGMAWYWTLLVKEPGRRTWVHLLMFVLFGTLAAYNHHFSLLLAALIGFSGLFFIARPYLFRYILAGCMIFLLYLPHLRIFIYQLELGGVGGWLGKPENTFFLSYVRYLFNYSLYALFLAAALAVAAFILKERKGAERKVYLFFAAWFLLPFLIGFFYSKYVNAVLQFSVLIFSTPFLFLVLFGQIRNLGPKINLLLVSLIILVNTLTLVLERRHYELFYQSVYEAILTDRPVDEEGKKTLALVDSDRKITSYYLEKDHIDSSFTWIDTLQQLSYLKAFLDREAADYDLLYLGSTSRMDPLVYSLILDYFPGLAWQKNYFAGTTALYNRDGETPLNPMFHLDFDSTPEDCWSVLDTGRICDSSTFDGRYSYRIDSALLYGPSCRFPLPRHLRNSRDFLEISLMVRSESVPDDVLLVASMESGGKQFFWMGSSFSSFYSSGVKEGDWVKVHLVLKLSDIYMNYPGIGVKIYVWNRGRKTFLIDRFEISERNGNPLIYSQSGKF